MTTSITRIRSVLIGAGCPREKATDTATAIAKYDEASTRWRNAERNIPNAIRQSFEAAANAVRHLERAAFELQVLRDLEAGRRGLSLAGLRLARVQGLIEELRKDELPLSPYRGGRPRKFAARSTALGVWGAMGDHVPPRKKWGVVRQVMGDMGYAQGEIATGVKQAQQRLQRIRKEPAS